MTDTVRYPNMKDSGIKWIGYVPASWNVRTLYQLATRVKNKNSDLSEQNLLSLSYGKIKRKDINTNDGLLPASFDGYNIIEAGDIVLRLTDLQNDHTSLRVGQATERGIITSAYTTLHPINPAHSRYLYYLIHAFDLKKGFYGMGSGVRQGLNYDEVKELRVVLPSQSEQDAIVGFLDTQTSNIDSLIEEAKASIEEYKQWKISIVNEAVTKGLVLGVEMRDSGIPWIGKIPFLWNKLPLKRVILSRDGGAWGNDPKGDINDRICMRIADFDFDMICFKNRPIEEYTARSYSENQVRKLELKRDYVCIEKSGGGEKTPVGRAVLFDKGFSALYANFMDRLIINEEYVTPRFFTYYWQAMYFHSVSTVYIKQTTGIQNLNLAGMIENEYVVFPSLNEQAKITRYLDEKSQLIRNLIEEKQTLIEELEAYKRSLIYEVVTGKRKVGL